LNKEMKFTVILPICHGGKFLENALDSLAKLEFSPEHFEVLLAGPDYDEKLQHMLAAKSADTGIHFNYIRGPQSNRSALLNAAISQARGRIFVFTDDDCTFPQDWLTRFSGVFARELNIGVVGGLDRTAKDEPALNVALDYVLNSFLGTGGLRRRGSGVGKYYPKLWNMAVPRETALSLALDHEEGLYQVFDESLDVHEDVALIDRIEKAGKRIVFSPEVFVTHSRDTTLRTFTRRSFNMARTSRSIGVHRLPHFSLAFFALGMIILTAAAIFFRPIRTVSAAAIIIYAAILLLGGLGGYIRTRRLSVFFYIPVLFVAQHFSRGLGYLFPWQRPN